MSVKGTTYSVQANIQPIDPNTGLFTPIWYLYLISLQTQLSAVGQDDSYIASIGDQSGLISNLQSSISAILSRIESIPEYLPEISNITASIQSLNNEFHSKNDVIDVELTLKNLITTQSSFIAYMSGLLNDQQVSIDALSKQVSSLQSYVNQAGI